VDDNRLGEVLHSGGQSGNYRGSKEFVSNRYQIQLIVGGGRCGEDIYGLDVLD
jgi:hypothetical protein